MNIANRQNFDFSKDDLSSPEQIAFLEYWQLIRGEKPMPSRIDFDPMKIPASLPHIVMEDVHHDPLRFKIRLIGSKCNIPGSYLGKYIDEMPEMAPAIKMLRNCIKKKKPYFYFDTITMKSGVVRYYSSLVVPFSKDGSDVNILMACHCLID